MTELEWNWCSQSWSNNKKKQEDENKGWKETGEILRYQCLLWKKFKLLEIADYTRGFLSKLSRIITFVSLVCYIKLKKFTKCRLYSIRFEGPNFKYTCIWFLEHICLTSTSLSVSLFSVQFGSKELKIHIQSARKNKYIGALKECCSITMELQIVTSIVILYSIRFDETNMLNHKCI